MNADGRHECAAIGCTKRCANEYLMCVEHWRMVPREIANRVWSTWRRVLRDRPAYLEARQAAIDAVGDVTPRQGGLF